MNLESIGNCIDVVESCPETTLSLETAIQESSKSVSSFFLPPSLKTYVEEFLEICSSERGQGFWVQAEYGAGKTHITLETLANTADKQIIYSCFNRDLQKESYEKIKSFSKDHDNFHLIESRESLCQ